MAWTRESICAFMEESIPFNRHLGMKVVSFTTGRAEIRVPFSDFLVGDPFRPALHGGVLSTLLDTVGGLAAFSVIDDEQRVSTLDLVVDYLRPGPLTDIIGVADVVRRGNRVVLVNMSVRAAEPDDAPICATGRAVYNIFDPRDR